MLKHRIFTAILLLLGLWCIFFVLPITLFIPVVMLICLLAITEVTRMYNYHLVDTLGIMVVFTLICLVLYFISYDTSQIVRIVAIICWCFVVPFILIWQPKSFSHLGLNVLVLLMFVPAFYALIVLYGLLGAWQLISIMAIAWIADIGAYFVGRRFGQHKLVPTISPSKSLEGAFAGLVCVLIYLLILKYFNLTVYLYSYEAVFKFGIILVTVSILGDLIESWFKRVAKVKDSGVLLPGHGGIYDRIDSIIAVVAVAYAMIRGLF